MSTADPLRLRTRVAGLFLFLPLLARLGFHKLVQKAEATVHVSGKNIHAETSDSNLYVAIDALVDSLDRQVLKHKEKHTARRHDETGKQAAAAE